MRETPAAFARRLGIHKSTVSRAIAAGRLVLCDGLIDVAENLQRWQDTKAGTRPDVAARHAAIRTPANPECPPSPETAPDGPAEDQQEGQGATLPAAGEQTLAHYAQSLLAAQNSLSRLAVQLRTHKRYPLESISREAHALGATLRGALERLVDQLAPRIAVQATDADRQHLLSSEAWRVRSLLRRELPRALRRLRATAPDKK
jgi:hypothetical protein